MALREFDIFILRGLVAVAAMGLCACAVVGPRSISGGRGAYTEVINITEDEQILNLIVRQRYDETFGMISVASITAGLRFSAQVGTNIGIGNSDNYAGNLVPLSAGVAYEENPTISYVPLSGEDFTRRMLSPLSVSECLLLDGAIKHPGRLFALAVSRVNGLRNPLLGEAPPLPEFARTVELYDRLRRADVLDFVEEPETGGESRYLWYIHDYAPAYADSVREILDLIGIEVKVDGSPIILPVLRAIGRSSSAVHLQNRSAYEILDVFGAGIEIPSSHLDAGIVEPAGSTGAEDFMTIRSSEEHWWSSRPEDATVAVRFRDRWFYISATDRKSKRALLFLRTLIGMRLADPGVTQRAPVLTVPVN